MERLVTLMLVVFVVLVSCGGQPRSGDECSESDYGKKSCGTDCVQINESQCLAVGAVLRCDGYTWRVRQICSENCSCVEEDNCVYCDCNYY